MRIEAAAYQSKPVYFELIGPWTRPQRMQPYQPIATERVAFVMFVVLSISVLAASIVFARRNLRLGRGDRRGAFRLAVFVFAGWGVAAFFGAHHALTFREFDRFILLLSRGLLFSSVSWILYLALEPYVRRRWPATLISWSRLLAGRFQDPLVGRDALIGSLLGAFSIALVRLVWFVPGWLGFAPPQPYSGPQSELLGARAIIADISTSLIGAPVFWLAGLFVLFLFRVLLRKEWAAVLASALLFTVLFSAALSELAPVLLVSRVITNTLTVLLLIRFGFLAVVASQVFNGVLSSFPLTTDGSAWYAGISLVGILLMAAMALYGFYTSLGGRPVFGGVALEE
jgi:serine/threonine-protein kinase